ncbi:hypothetical protein Tco_1256711 [Tanacetum coccineum]
MFAATTPENTPMAYRASTSANPNPVIRPAFIKANYEALESLLRDRRRQMRNNDLRTELEYFSEDYDEEREMEPRPEPTRAATPPLRVASPRIRGRPSEEAPRGNGGQSVNLPPLLAAHLGRGENGQPLQSSLTSAYGGAVLNPVGSVTPFMRWIEEYPLPDRLKMPSHIGSYDGKGDPDNFLHLFEGAIRMQKWLMPILGLHVEQRISGFGHGLRTRSLVEHLSTDLPSTYKDLMEKIYTWDEVREVSNNGASSDRRDSFKRSKKRSWDNNRGQKNKDIFSPYRGPNHGLLPSLSESSKEILATKKVARSFESPPKIFESKRSRDMSKYCHFHEDYGHDTNDCRHLRTQIQEAVNSGQLSHLVKGIKKERTKSSDTPQGESKKDKGIAPTEAPILMVNNAPVIIEAKIFRRKVGRVYMDSGSSCEIIYKHCFEKLNPTIKATKVDLKTPLVGFSGERSWSIGEVLKNSDAKDGNHKTDEAAKRARKILATNEEGVLICLNAEEKIIVNDKYPDQMVTIGKQLPEHFKKELQNLLKSNADVFTWTHADMTRIPRTIMVEGKPFNMEHKMNEYNHVKPIKQNKRGLGPDRNMAAYKETEELTKAGILCKVKHQTWVDNPVMVKKSDGGWRMCMDFTDINKAYPKDCYPLPEIDWKIESLSGFRLKCFLDAYKGYHQIQMVKEDEDKTAF